MILLNSLVPRPSPPPVFDHLQDAIRRWKTCEILSCAVTSGRQTVYTRGWGWGLGGGGRMENLKALSCIISPRAEGQSVSLSVSIPFAIHSTRDRSTRNGNYYCPAPFHVCLPSVYLMSPHMTKSPRPSPSVFAYCKRSNTGGGNGLGMRLTFEVRMHFLVIACPCT